jgi:hypothetical protein
MRRFFFYGNILFFCGDESARTWVLVFSVSHGVLLLLERTIVLALARW